MSAQQQTAVDLATPLVRSLAIGGEAVALAVLRDLQRLERVLDGPVTAVRRQALVAHLGFVLDQVTGQHRLMDTAIWPVAVAGRPDLADLADEARAARTGLTWTLSELRATARQWARTASSRVELLAALREATPRLRRVIERDLELLPVALSAVEFAAGPSVPASGESRLPTAVARRLFWLLDELDDARAALLLTGTPPYRLWILRNGFSGGYNRSSYLMWVGGGTGPAV